MPRHILIKLTKTKHKVRILKAAREKQQVAYKGNPIRLTADLSAEALQDRRDWQDILKVFKGKNLQPRLQYLARISFKIDGKVKNFLDKQKLREFRTTKPAFGEGNGTPLQYFCLENPMDGGAWKAAVHGVSESQTQLSNFTFTFMHWRRKWQPTPVFLPGESQGWGSLVGCRLWGHTESDMTEAT